MRLFARSSRKKGKGQGQYNPNPAPEERGEEQDTMARVVSVVDREPQGWHGKAAGGFSTCAAPGHAVTAAAAARIASSARRRRGREEDYLWAAEEISFPTGAPAEQGQWRTVGEGRGTGRRQAGYRGNGGGQRGRWHGGSAHECVRETDGMVLFWKEPACFVQWTPSFFEIEGVMYCNAEQWMMASKAKLFGDSISWHKIMSTADPREQKALGRKVRGFEAKAWDECGYDVVTRGNLEKFRQNPAFLAQLLATGDKILAEASPYDLEWGIGLDAHDENALIQQKWPGKNKLGEVLMDVRSMLREEANASGFAAGGAAAVVAPGDALPDNGLCHGWVYADADAAAASAANGDSLQGFSSSDEDETIGQHRVRRQWANDGQPRGRGVMTARTCSERVI